jgi:hypothetical protein
MTDQRLVQCFGIRRRPGKEAKLCRRRFLWTAAGTHGNFGRKGTRGCPHCGNLPDFSHPINRALNGEISQDEAINQLNTGILDGEFYPHGARITKN